MVRAESAGHGLRRSRDRCGPVSAEDHTALREGAYLLRSPANARRLLKAYENALEGTRTSERESIAPDVGDPE